MPLFFGSGAIIERDFYVSIVFMQIEPSFRRSSGGRVEDTGSGLLNLIFVEASA